MRAGCLGLQSQMPGSDQGKPMVLIVGSYSHQNSGLLPSPNTAIHASARGSVPGLCPPGVTRAETESQTLRRCWRPAGPLRQPGGCESADAALRPSWGLRACISNRRSGLTAAVVQEPSQNLGLHWEGPTGRPLGKKGEGSREIQAQHRLTSSPDHPSGVLWSWNDPSEVSQVGSEGWDLSHRPRTAEGTQRPF